MNNEIIASLAFRTLDLLSVIIVGKIIYYNEKFEEKKKFIKRNKKQMEMELRNFIKYVERKYINRSMLKFESMFFCDEIY